jgi:hypothetical protein
MSFMAIFPNVNVLDYSKTLYNSRGAIQDIYFEEKHLSYGLCFQWKKFI